MNVFGLCQQAAFRMSPMGTPWKRAQKAAIPLVSCAHTFWVRMVGMPQALMACTIQREMVSGETDSWGELILINRLSEVCRFWVLCTYGLECRDESFTWGGIHGLILSHKFCMRNEPYSVNFPTNMSWSSWECMQKTMSSPTCNC